MEINGQGVTESSTVGLLDKTFWTFLGKKNGEIYWYDHTEGVGFLELDC